MYKHFFILALFLWYTTSALAYSTLEISNVKVPGQRWQAQISTMECVSTVTGMFSRTLITIAIKDTVAPIQSDSLEAVLTFDLPENSVVDSMYLWIDGKPEPGYLKKAWAATQIFENIVKRRQDPALLKKNNENNYTIRIFPFKTRQERVIRICYTTPLTSVLSGKMDLEMPLAITQASIYPPKSISVDVSIPTILPSFVNVTHDNQGQVIITSLPPQGSQVSWKIQQKKYVTPFSISMLDQNLSQKGLMVNFGQDTGKEVFFSVLLTPGKLVPTPPQSKRKTVVIWNTAISQTVIDDWVNKKYHIKHSYTYDTYLEYELSELRKFILNTFTKGDRINILINSTLLAPFALQFVELNDSSLLSLDIYLKQALSPLSKDSGCVSPLDAIDKGLSLLSPFDTSKIIIIDRAYHGYFPFALDSSIINSNAQSLLKKIPKHSVVYWATIQNNKSLINATYTTIQASFPQSIVYNQMIPEVFVLLAQQFEHLFNPASLVFTSPTTRFPYDIIGPRTDLFSANQTYWYIGKMFKQDKLHISFKGMLDGSNYSYDSTFETSNSAGTYHSLSDVWASQKVNQLISTQNSTSNNSAALNTSLTYRILTPLTALLALEKGIADSLKMCDDKASTITDTLKIQKIKDQTTQTSKELTDPTKESIAIIHAASHLFIKLPVVKESELTTDLTLCVFDIKGKLILKKSLNKQLQSKNAYISFALGSLSPGMYIAQLRYNTTVFTKNICISR